MAEPRERILWIDLARAFAILSVITYHSGVFPYWYFLGAFQLPLFAFLSGYATNWAQLNLSKLSAKWLRWGSAYTLAGLGSLIFWVVILLMYRPVPTALQLPLGTNLSAFFSGAGMPSNGHLWFLLPFALATTIFALFSTLKAPYKWIFLLCIVPFTNVPMQVFFVSLLLGTFWREYEIDTELNAPHTVILGLFFLLSAYLNGPTYLHFSRLGNPFFFAISSLSGTLLAIHCATILPNFVTKRITTSITWIGKNSLLFFVLHWPVLIGVVFLLWKLQILSIFGAQPGVAGPLMPFEKNPTGVLKALSLWSVTFTSTLGFTALITKGIYTLSTFIRQGSYRVRPLKITLIGHVCIDHNTSEHAEYTAPGGPAIFMNRIFSQLPKNTVEIIAPYGQDFLEIAPQVPFHPSVPVQKSTLVYSNDSSGKKRVQKALQRSFARPPVFTTELLESIEQSDIVFLTPLTPQYTLKDLEPILEHKRESQLFILLPQGYFRDFTQDNLVVVREGSEVDALAAKFDAIIVSNEDHPKIAQKAERWAESTRVITTLGEQGARYQYGSEDFIVPTQPVILSEIVDSVGSGDIFSSAFAYEYFQSRSALKALTFANKIARQCLYFSAKDITITLK